MTPTPAQGSSAPSAHVNSATLIMGLTKSGKSSLLGTVAEYVWETYGLVSRLYSSDGGGFPTQVEALAKVGIIQFWRMRFRSGENLAQETAQRAAQGWWPERIDPRTGITAPDVRLIPPVTSRVELLCPNGHVVRVAQTAAGVMAHAVNTCPTCKVTVTKENATTRKASHQTKGFERVGANLFDGLSSMLSWGMDDLSERTGRQELRGEQSALGGIVSSGDLKLTGSTRPQYGFMQKRAESLVLFSNSIPNLVIPPVWTALTLEGSDEGGLTVVGPQIVGQAKTAEAPQWFGDCLESIIIETNDKKKYRRLNLQPYVDAQGRRHLCGVRSYPGKLPAYLEDEDLGEQTTEPFVNFSMGTYYRLREKARTETEQEYLTKYANAPGVPEGEVVIGEGDATAPAQPASATAKPVPSGGVAAPVAGRVAGRPVVRVGALAARVKPAAVATPAPAPVETQEAAAAPAAATEPTEPVATAQEETQTAAAQATATPAPPPTPSPAVTGPVRPAPAAARPPQRGPAIPAPPGRRVVSAPSKTQA